MAVVQEFVYRAVDPRGGSVVKGNIEAASESAVTTKLKAQGLTPLEVTLKSNTGLNREIKLPGATKTVSARTLAVFSRQMAGLINAGLPLMRTLSILIEQTDDKRLQPALVQVQADVESGSSFSAALARHPQTFPPLMLSIIKVGEAGGFLGSALGSIADNYQREAELHNKIRAAVTYPAIVLIIAIIGVLVMVTFVVPIFEGMFKGLGSALPLPTQILVTISNNMWWIIPAIVLVVIVAVVWWRANRHTEQYRRVVDPIKLKMPVFGKLTTKIAVARFARNLSMMLNAGVPIIQALAIVGQASNNWKIEQAVRDVQESIRQGRSFAAPLAKADVFPAMVPQMVSVGEESGTLVDMLASIADFYEDEVETATAQLSSTIEPILIVGLGIVIGGMVVSLYLPIFTLYGELAQQG
ncbi:type II secretion system F family protein [Microbacterium sp. M3]|uniref:Type II secretion system F family protein n=1 Tax=Microbacterium arthrosphaerae TaxID=792652 RepID=A0ABU4GYT0_9MICO|nr:MULTISPECIES: type II secretion system F family protein [Microbacterium]MDW4572241.1 type II secretion system F family protein [Microbacterium arthrosphaerae]MDW7606096.1 type II secretion system F family protein [Microbacterium sp. M3]